MLLGAAASVAADEVDLDRQVSVSEDSHSFHAVSDSRGFNVNDRFILVFSDGTIDLWYIKDVTASNPSSWDLKLSFDKLFSFVDNGNGHFDSADTVVSTLNLSDSHYSLTYALAPIAGGGNETTVTAVSEDGALTLTFVFTTSPVLVGSVPISPSNVKLDITISDASLAVGADFIGLSISVEVGTSSSIHLEDIDDSAQLNITQSGLGGFFRWSDNATVDGIQHPVSVNWTSEDLTLSYPAGNLIVHDPVIGVRSMAPLSGLPNALKPAGDLLLYGVGSALAVGTIIGMIVIRGRKNH